MRPPLGLGALAGVVDQEGVDQRQVAQRGVGSAGRRHAQRLAGQPFQVAVLAEVHYCVTTESGVQPVVGGEVMVAGRQVGVVVDGDGVFPEPAGRLHHQDQVPGLHCGDDDFAVGVVCAVDEQVSGRRSPVPRHRVGQFGGQSGEPVAIVLGGHPDRVAGQLPFGEPVGVLSAAFDQRVDQRVAVAGFDAGQVAHPVPVLAHRPQQRDRAGRGVQPDRIADAGVLGGVGREHQGDPLVGRSDVPQLRVSHRQARDPRAAFRVGDIGDEPVVVDFLERERDRDDAPVELGHRHLGGHVERAEAVVVVHPVMRGSWSGRGPAGSECPGPPGVRRSSCRHRRRRTPWPASGRRRPAR